MKGLAKFEVRVIIHLFNSSTEPLPCPPAGGEEKYNLGIIFKWLTFQKTSPQPPPVEGEKYSLAIIFKLLSILASPRPSRLVGTGSPKEGEHAAFCIQLYQLYQP
jgi:hypothetical protein